jgi:tRNA dimethylallyltransferase
MLADEFTKWIHPPLRDAWFLTGPTSSGKTPLAIALAERLGAEIISLDSMAIYRGMDIGTAKPTAEQQAQVPHHMLDVVEPTESFSVSSYVLAAHESARQIRERGKRVLVCGGTPLYLKGLVRGLFLGPAADWEFRAAIESDIVKHGAEPLRDRLKQVDPLLAHKLHPHDHRRMIRALEVARVTGRPLSHWQEQFETPASPADFPVAVLRLDRAWLHERINSRVETMLARGLEGEIVQLLECYGQLGRTAAQAVGYREMLEFLRGGTTLGETTALIKAHTRQFARRQEIWFRGLSELQPVPVSPEATLADVVDRIASIFTTPLVNLR